MSLASNELWSFEWLFELFAMPKGPPTSKNDVILTGFIARGPHNSASNIDEFGESESDLDLNLNGGASVESYTPL